MYGYICSTCYESRKQCMGYTTGVFWSINVLDSQSFDRSTLWFVDVLVFRRLGLSTFWFVDVLGCRRFGLSTFRFVDVLVCRRFGLSTFWLSTFRFVDVLTSYQMNKPPTTSLKQHLDHMTCISLYTYLYSILTHIEYLQTLSSRRRPFPK